MNCWAWLLPSKIQGSLRMHRLPCDDFLHLWSVGTQILTKSGCHQSPEPLEPGPWQLWSCWSICVLCLRGQNENRICLYEVLLDHMTLGNSFAQTLSHFIQCTHWHLLPTLYLREFSMFACWAIHCSQYLPWLCFMGWGTDSTRAGIISVLPTFVGLWPKEECGTECNIHLISIGWTSDPRSVLSPLPGQSLDNFRLIF